MFTDETTCVAIQNVDATSEKRLRFLEIFILKCFLKGIRKFYFIFFLQHWEVFKKVTEVFILVPALLGLKGNLEMTLASRLSTAVSFFLYINIYCFSLLRRTCTRKIIFFSVY